LPALVGVVIGVVIGALAAMLRRPAPNDLGGRKSGRRWGCHAA
jgi:gas vesicle protein